MTVYKIFTYLSVLLLLGCDNNRQSPFSPERSLKDLVLAEGFEIELIASEPLVRDPVDMTFDANGQLYVVEMPEYPSRGAGSPPSNIVLLNDTNNDGVYDKRTIFANDLPFVNGVMAWKDGVLVTNAPDIIYFADTTGDGRADIRKVILSGFAETNPQLRVSHLRYGIDNWIYGAYFNAGGSGGDPQFAGTGEPLYFPERSGGPTFDISSGMDFRFRPDDFIAERSGGHSQFGNTFDDEGNRFTLMNADHIRHVVIPYRYTSANPYYSMSAVMESVSDHGKAARLYSITENMLNFRLTDHEVGHVTSACGIVNYTGNLFPAEYKDASFVCDPARNVVHADILSREGATFKASRALAEQEFIASPDSWFRPVSAKVGPDGALYLVDMYRKLVEHPAYIPHSGVKTEDGAYVTQAGRITESDFYEGQHLGRIYRITPKGYTNKNYSAPKLNDASSAELVKQLDNTNMWWRITAQRLLVERGDLSVVELLKKTAASASPHGRMHALWCLQGLGQLGTSTVLMALEDDSPLVRKQAIILSEFYLSDQEVRDKLVTLAKDSDTHVQFQLALTLSLFPDSERFDPLLEVAKQHMGDHWFRSGIALSIVDDPLTWFEHIYSYKATEAAAGKGKSSYLQTIAAITGVRQKDNEITRLFSLLSKSSESDSLYQVAGLTGLRSGLQQGELPRRISSAAESDLLKFIQSENAAVQNAAAALSDLLTLSRSPELNVLLQNATTVAMDASAPTAARMQAVKLLGLNPDGIDTARLSQLLSLQQATDIQNEAAKVLLKEASPAATQLLLDKWESYTSDIRKTVEAGFVERNELALALLTAIEKGDLESSLLTQGSKSILKQNPDNKIRSLADSLFNDVSAANRDDAVASFYESTTIEGDIAKGKAIFKQLCSECHQLDDVGFNVGPDLHSFSSRPKTEFLRAIVDPNFEISPGYDGNIIETKDGQFISGTIVNETTDHIVLRMVGGREQTVARKNINTIRPMGTSLMPVGLEGGMEKQDMADLLTYLKSFE